MEGRIEKYILSRLRKGPLHFSLVDPEKFIPDIADGTDAILVGGSTGVTENMLDKSITEIKKSRRQPVILFPGNTNGVSRKADAIFFMSLLNSTDPLWITGMQIAAAPAVRRMGIEAIPMAYLIVEPGMRAGEVGKANLIKTSEDAVRYALAAELMGMRFVYLEAGSGAHKPVSAEIIKAVKRTISAKLIVGGGIRSAEAVISAVKAGADIIVTGTIIEKNPEKVSEIISAVRKFRR